MNNNSLGGQLQGQPTTEQQQLNEKMQFIATYGEQAYNQREKNKLSREKLERLRDEFAMAALPMAWAQEAETPTFDGTYKGIAVRAYLMADAALKAREIK